MKTKKKTAKKTIKKTLKKTPSPKPSAPKKKTSLKKVSAKKSVKKPGKKPSASSTTSRVVSSRSPAPTTPVKKSTKQFKTKPESKPREKPVSRSETRVKVAKPKTTKPKTTKPKAAKPQAHIVPINPKTGREEKKPSGKQVLYAIKDAKGKLTRIPFEDSQKYSVKDKQGLNAAFQAGGPKQFIVYEEMTKDVKRDKNGNIIYRMKAGRYLLDSVTRKKIPLRKTKLTYAKSKNEQKPVLVIGKKTRSLDIGFRKRAKRERPQAKHLIPLATSRKKWSQEIAIYGDTLKETCNKIQVPLSLAEFRKHAKDGLGVQGRIKIVTNGDETIIPFRTSVDVLANFAKDVSQAMRYALSDHGLRFTSLVTLQDLASENPDMEEVLMYVGRAKRAVESLSPIFGENEDGEQIQSQTARNAPRVSVVLSIQPF